MLPGKSRIICFRSWKYLALKLPAGRISVQTKIGQNFRNFKKGWYFLSPLKLNWFHFFIYYRVFIYRLIFSAAYIWYIWYQPRLPENRESWQQVLAQLPRIAYFYTWKQASLGTAWTEFACTYRLMRTSHSEIYVLLVNLTIIGFKIFSLECVKFLLSPPLSLIIPLRGTDYW